MTVAELIAELQKLDQTLEVQFLTQFSCGEEPEWNVYLDVMSADEGTDDERRPKAILR